jgi:hypothetical protein
VSGLGAIAKDFEWMAVGNLIWMPSGIEQTFFEGSAIFYSKCITVQGMTADTRPTQLNLNKQQHKKNEVRRLEQLSHSHSCLHPRSFIALDDALHFRAFLFVAVSTFSHSRCLSYIYRFIYI